MVNKTTFNPIQFVEASLQHYKQRYAEAKAEDDKNWEKISFLRKQIYNLNIALQTYYN
jgi:hypothetical protein